MKAESQRWQPTTAVPHCVLCVSPQCQWRHHGQCRRWNSQRFWFVLLNITVFPMKQVLLIEAVHQFLVPEWWKCSSETVRTDCLLSASRCEFMDTNHLPALLEYKGKKQKLLHITNWNYSESAWSKVLKSFKSISIFNLNRSFLKSDTLMDLLSGPVYMLFFQVAVPTSNPALHPVIQQGTHSRIKQASAAFCELRSRHESISAMTAVSAPPAQSDEVSSLHFQG